MTNKLQVQYAIVRSTIFHYVMTICHGMAEKLNTTKTNEQQPLVDDSLSSEEEERGNLRLTEEER